MIETTINKAESLVITTWINSLSNQVSIYRGSDGKHYYRAIGIPLTEIDSEFVSQLIRLEENRDQ